jgi:hypothetical protein
MIRKLAGILGYYEVFKVSIPPVYVVAFFPFFSLLAIILSDLPFTLFTIDPVLLPPFFIKAFYNTLDFFL